jgi:hypothetical protein
MLMPGKEKNVRSERSERNVRSVRNVRGVRHHFCFKIRA